MTSSRALHVVSTRLGQWHVRREGDPCALSEHGSATEAVREARVSGADEILVHDRYDRVHWVQVEAQ